MNTESTRLEEGLFAGALALPPTGRMDFLRRACGDDEHLLARLVALIHGHEEINGAMDASLPEAMAGVAEALHAKAPEESDTPRQIGRYHLRAKLGEGGFGEVWRAEQAEPVRREVALKIIRPGMGTRDVVARFEIERQALAMMDHPSIARVFDGGTTQNGRPYFVMELVRGVPITRYCDEHRLGATERLHLFLQVCSAVQHAHQKGIIHRDLKPSNILVSEVDGVAVPKVIDFGIAKAVSGRITEATLLTLQAQVMGTPAYMSPEQFDYGRGDIDTRSDIYNLGVLLYELLTGRTPFDAEQLSSKSLDELRDLIREREPLKPSTRVTTLDGATRERIAGERNTDSVRLRATLRGDIDWIVMCCLEKERSRRYETANGLARDIERHLGHEPIAAHPPTPAYVLKKTIRRHRVAFATGGVIAASLLFAVVASRVEAQRATAAEQTAQTERSRAEVARDDAEKHKRTAELEGERSAQVAQVMKNMLKGVGPQVARGRDTALLRTLLDDESARIQKDTSTQVEVTVDLLQTIGQVYSAIGEHRLGEKLLREALRRHEQKYGRENLIVAGLLHEIGRMIELQGASYRPDAPFSEALALREKLLPPNHLDLARTRSEFGGYTARWEPEEGEKLLRRALEVQRAQLGVSHPDLALTLGYLSRATRKSDPEASEQFARESVAIYREAFGPDETESFESTRELAQALGQQSRHAEAEQILRLAIERCRRLLSPAHPMLPDLLLDLSGQLNAQKRIADEETVLMEAIELAQRHDLPGPAGQIIQRVNGLLIRLKKLDQAEKITRRQIELTRPRADEYPMMMAISPDSVGGCFEDARSWC